VLRLRRSVGTAFLSGCSSDVEAVLVEGALRCGRGGTASSACFGCGVAAGADAGGVACTACFGWGFAAFGLGAIAWSACFGWGLLAGCVGAAGVASVDDVEADGGIVMAGFFAAGACF
jgi:hypothetical protein